MSGRWEAPPSNSVSFTVPDNWKAGRIWGVPPVSVAEWTLQGDGNQDFYDVSLVDGFNLPMEITFTAGIDCPTAGCPVDLIPNCPDPLKGPFDSNGIAVGCKSACDANLDGDPTDSANCCTGSHNTPATCPASGVQYYSYFKGNCPDAYAYAYDESSGTALLVCDAGIGADYTLTFCPPSGASSNAASGSAAANSAATIATGTSTDAAASSLTPASGSSAAGSVTSVAGTSSTTSSTQGVAGSDTARPNGAALQRPVIAIMFTMLTLSVAVTLVVGF
uniref:CAG pathogenicity island protein 23 (Protein PicB) n=1 Tax=Ganoderma boninense TaxID=34458 RepID=A0A5K1K6B9_9APHY|nr:CAG pathogenicity island protein 23 (Protein PicB) [Ganoderma boninense]